MKKAILVLAAALLPLAMMAEGVKQARQINPTTFEVIYKDGNTLTLDFYGENIVRMFQDNAGGIVRNPLAEPPAEILVKNPRTAVGAIEVKDSGAELVLSTSSIRLAISKVDGSMKVEDLRTAKTVASFTEAPSFAKSKTTLTLSEDPDEYFYGGGVQNGRFSHKGKIIAIENQNSWTDGGVASPNPFYWSTKGYGVMFHTFKKGKYDFGASEPGVVKLSHQSSYLDAFVMVDAEPEALLRDFYQLTGNPVLLPKFGFYEGHLNAYNRDYWTEDENGIPFEDGKRYKESQKDNGGIKESLNGKKDNYQFSARAVVDRYAAYDMPLGWVLPNDGYGAGYGQTSTLEGNVENLRQFGDYAREHGVEIGLWTQSDLHPKEGVEALLQRDIVREIRDAGVRVLKTDVAWVGAGYSFGLNGISDVGELMPYYGNNARPFIISLDAWAGSQRYAGIWSGDQTGGEWEYIRFHIPTYIGSGLSGQPNITSDMDGIFGGKNIPVNVRDFEWKTWTPMQLNMDGWGSNEKYPHALGEPATSINRHYLKLKSQLLPYSYSIAAEAVSGQPMIRAMFLEECNEYTLGTATKYQYMYGPYFLVAPIYQSTDADADGNDIRDGIYLPEGKWIDYFNGDVYDGGCIINNFEAPLWKIPVFVKAGAIIPMAQANNNVGEIDPALRMYEIYPYASSEFTEYDDDGVSELYKAGACTRTTISSSVDAKGNATVKIGRTMGDFEGAVREKSTRLAINATAVPKSVYATVGGVKVKLVAASDKEEFEKAENAYYYDAAPELNRFASKGSSFADVKIVKNPQILVKLGKTDIRANETLVTVKGYQYDLSEKFCSHGGALEAPSARVLEEDSFPYAMAPSWDAVENADYYEIEFDGQRYSKIRRTRLVFDDLCVETPYSFKVRAVNADGCSEWSECSGTTKSDPLEFAISGIRGKGSLQAWEDFEESRLFDFAIGGDIWYTDALDEGEESFDLMIDLRGINTLDRLVYLPRPNAGGGTLMKGSIAISLDKENWTDAGSFDWKRDKEEKTFEFAGNPNARFIRMTISESYRRNGSGREIYVFRVPGSDSTLSGDINNDGKLDMNDLTSYMNYTGLRLGDGDFEGYVSVGDVNMNNLIDACDIATVATEIGLEEDERLITAADSLALAGKIAIAADKRQYAKGEDILITVSGEGLEAVNALSFALPYDQTKYEYVGIETPGMKQMENFTNDRLHTNGKKSLYPTFVNVGKKDLLSGDATLMVIRFRAKEKLTFDLKAIDGLLVDRELNTLKF